MKSRLTLYLSVLILFLSTTIQSLHAQRFPGISYRNMKEAETKGNQTGYTVQEITDYRIALYKYSNVLTRFPIVRDWIEDNRYVQVVPGRGYTDYVECDLFKLEGNTFSFEDSYTGYSAIRMKVPDEDYSIGMADNLGAPTRYIKFRLTKDKLTYTIITDQQGGCDFAFSDEWVADGNGASRGYIPIQPVDPHKEEIGCNGGSHKATALVYGVNGKGCNIIPYTYTCTHYIRQVPRTTGSRVGEYVVATKEYEEKKLSPGAVYIGMAGEYGGDPYAPWQFTYTTTVTISLPEMAKMNGMTVDELAYYFTSLSQSNNGLFLPTNKVAANKINNVCNYDTRNFIHEADENNNTKSSTYGIYLGLTDLDCFYPSIGDILAYGFWKVFNLETYARNYAKECIIEGQQYEAAQDYDKAKKAYYASVTHMENDSVWQKYEEVSYKDLMQKIENKTATVENLLHFLRRFDAIYKPSLPRTEKKKKNSKYWDSIYSIYLETVEKNEE